MILCAGEALIDMLPRTGTDGTPCFTPIPGGAVFNTAIALARLGAPTALFTGLSRDLFGQKLSTALRDSGVSTDLIPQSDRPTTLAFVELTDGHASYAFYDENTAARMLTSSDLPAPEALAEVQALFFGGISLVVEPCATAYAALLTREAPGRVVMIDPNIRPSFITDPDAYRTRLETLVAHADIVKVSDEDLTWLLGSGDPDDLARELLARGPGIVCLTRGASGVTAHHQGGRIDVPARKAKVVDTVGAGDTFNAGLLAGLHAGGALTKDALMQPDPGTLRDALALGTAAAAITVSRAGANPPTRSELA
jgi:fructokinase